MNVFSITRLISVFIALIPARPCVITVFGRLSSQLLYETLFLFSEHLLSVRRRQACGCRDQADSPGSRELPESSFSPRSPVTGSPVTGGVAPWESAPCELGKA